MLWRKNGKRVQQDGKMIRCDQCPCCKVVVIFGYRSDVGYAGLYGDRADFALADPQAAFPKATIYDLVGVPFTIANNHPVSGTEGFFPYDVVFLILPWSMFVPGGLGGTTPGWDQASLVAWFNTGRKRLVLVGEWDTAFGDYITNCNAIASALGSSMSVAATGSGGSGDATNGFVDTSPAPLTSGIAEIEVNAVGTVSGGTPMLTTTAGSVVLAYESLTVTGGKSEIVMGADSNLFGDLPLSGGGNDNYANTEFLRGFCSVPVAQ